MALHQTDTLEYKSCMWGTESDLRKARLRIYSDTEVKKRRAVQSLGEISIY